MQQIAPEHLSKIELVECPRDAMQGWAHPISTATKVDYLRQLLEVGFPVLDFGSFVSAKAIPQMADTAAVVQRLDFKSLKTPTRLLAIVANQRGAEQACLHEEIHFLGFPFSISETFQIRNTNSTRAESFERVKAIQQLCIQHGKELVIYLSMGFGNPYADPYNSSVLNEWAEKIAGLGIKIISLADTVGLATPKQIKDALTILIPQYTDIVFGVHLHSKKEDSLAKIQAALEGGCRRFDGALKGIGGCPMAQDDLVGNMDTELMIHYFHEKGFDLSLNDNALKAALDMTSRVFI
ncbi:hydroxymethylglutaryl-CoA lyase [Arachidicoccus rhizosphaerae]|uniref:Hydroxymethylglutaryl-CoA lyase n=1 Tax=Arachidicoccus rhizosphaerae TaxID=551991 RepID=A0A1H3WMQ1_9BACT|nr:hydroxymethylglutaryl-CoA lyase [Arachidicoccus rhizosphaerae]SDZ88399.1 hydroxymethylglutaryl-CoA lyase [Arachidicoccus rhizosphaerae]